MFDLLKKCLKINKLILGNSDGNLAAITMLSAIVISAILYLTNNVDRAVQSGRKNITNIHDRNMIKSSIAFVKYNIAKRKCIDLSSGIDKINCKITDEGNLERLLLSSVTVNDILTRYKSAGADNSLRLDKLKFTIKKSTVTDLHPLAFLFINSKYKVSSIDFDIDSNYNARKGNFFELTIGATIHFEDGLKEDISSYEKVIYSPSRVNQYVLSLNSDLYIGANKSAPDSGLMGTAEDGLGLRFFSPIFINGNLVIPDELKNEAEDIQFYSAPVIGKSLQKNLDRPVQYTPDNMSSLMLERIQSYHGLKRGMELSNYSPALSSIFSKNPKAFSTDLMVRCIAHAQTKYNVSASEGSRVVLSKEIGGAEDDFLLGLTRMNEFRTRKSNIPFDKNLMKKYFDNLLSNKKMVVSVRELTGIIPEFALGYDTPYRLKGTVENGLASMNSPTFNQVNDLEAIFVQKSNNLIIKNNNKSNAITIYEDCSIGKADPEEECKDEFNAKNSAIAQANTALTEKELAKTNWDTDKSRYEECLYNERPYLNLKISKVINQKSGNSAPSLVRLNTSYSPDSKKCFNYKNLKFQLKTNNFQTSNEGDKGEDGPNSTSADKVFEFRWADEKLNFKHEGGLEIGSIFKKLNGNDVFISEIENETLSKNADNLDILCKEFESKADSYSELNINYDFTDKSSFLSWNFNPISKKFQIDPSKMNDWSTLDNGKDVANQLIVSDSNDSFFHVYSILDKCIVDSDAKFLIGFLTCRRLIIKPRTKPLDIIGSFIVDKMEVAPTAVTAGVNFRNIFNAKAASLFVKADVLTANCYSSASAPLWHPYAGPKDIKRMKECSTNHIASEIDPFNWSSFAPECGVSDATELVTKCKPVERVYNFKTTLLGRKFLKK